MPATRRSRRTTATQPAVVAQLQSMVDALIKENRQLKRRLEKLAADGITSARRRQANPVLTGLARLERKVKAALGEPAKSGTRSTRAAAATRAPRARKPVSPEVAEKRRQALARARAVRAAKRASASDTGSTES